MTGDLRSVAGVVRHAIGSGSREEHRALAAIVGAWLLVVALQLWDVRGRMGAQAAAELLAVAVFSFGTLLLAATRLLGSDLARTGLDRDGAQAPREIVLALPVLASLSATCLGFAGAMVITRTLLGTSIWRMLIMSVFVLAMLALATGLVAGTTRTLFTWAQDRAAAAARAEAEADRARLAVLQAQLNPHFLFNALNTIASLTAASPARAERTVENLAIILRHTLERSTRTEATLDEEIGLVERYLEIERERFGSRLEAVYRIDPGLGAVALPTMTLQPLVENAVKHAIGRRLEGGTITITARAAGAELQLSVADDGDGFASGAREGTGLGNLRARLRSIYRDAARLAIESSPAGTRVTVAVPARPADRGVSGDTADASR